MAREARQRDPSLPIAYPFEKPFHEGFFGALFAPEKSIFLFDPLLILMIVLTVVAWKRFSPAVKAYVITGYLLLLAYIGFYARYTVWSGDFAWGDRYVSTAVELAVLLAVPLLLRYRRENGTLVWVAGIALVAISSVIQIASLCFWLAAGDLPDGDAGPSHVRDCPGASRTSSDSHWAGCTTTSPCIGIRGIMSTSPPGISCRFCCGG